MCIERANDRETKFPDRARGPETTHVEHGGVRERRKRVMAMINLQVSSRDVKAMLDRAWEDAGKVMEQLEEELGRHAEDADGLAVREGSISELLEVVRERCRRVLRLEQALLMARATEDAEEGDEERVWKSADELAADEAGMPAGFVDEDFDGDHANGDQKLVLEHEECVRDRGVLGDSSVEVGR